ncbi:hypothetical protein IDSA_00115 [Pseudidiomarina salinarum]|uniref:Uncharacterized protein n=1 Tax=Pseudidiomarina salinarum TaxID=435908 RepID=A0A094IZD6_9GAMM|nr:type II secretion system protein [Pseudidiomarina salinarum]KFZ31179.1 hypothetical protein IDSA_00115 [Pseudidiomarina salinarum]RUO71073.1 prepilin-type cleavage/methylation domain-containing protein [Pseudidiomarina salinarum]
MSPQKSPKAKGFTIIELVVVMVIIGILAVSAAPVFLGRDGVDEYLFQARLQSVLRLQQQRAMQDTINCYAVRIESNRFAAVDDCNASSISDPLTDPGSGIAADEAQDAGVTLSSSAASVPYNIPFNALGCPVAAPADCEAGVNHQITLSGQSALQVCVTNQGYVTTGSCP